MRKLIMYIAVFVAVVVAVTGANVNASFVYAQDTGVILSKADYKSITEIILHEDGFSATYFDDGYMSVLGELEVNYSDGTYETLDYSYVRLGYQDEYGNEIQGGYSICETDDGEQAVVEVKYLNKNSTVWKSIPALKIEVEEVHVEVVELVEGKTFDTTSTDNDLYSFVFKPVTTGDYLIDVETDHIIDDETEDEDDDANITVKDGDGKEVKMKSDLYHLEAGITYKIEIMGSGDRKITVLKPRVIADVEITGYKGHIYKDFEEAFGDDSVELKVTYADGTTETVSGADKLSNRRKVRYSFGKRERDGITIVAEVAGKRASLKIPYSNKNDIASLIFKKKVSYTILPRTTSGNARYYIYKMVVPADGIYGLDYVYDEAFMVPAAGGSWVKAATVLKNKLKKGSVYYLKVLADLDGGAFGVAPARMLKWQTVKKPTCTVPGVKKRYDTELGMYVTEKIPAKGHSYASRWTLVKRADSKSNGYKAQICTKCGGESPHRKVIKKISSVKLEKTKYVYDAKVHKPKVIVKDSSGKVIPDTKYKVTYPGTKSVGKVIVKITFKGGYAGTLSRSFKIVPKASTIKSIRNTTSGVKITWSRSANAGGYFVQRKKGNGKYVTIAKIKSNKTLSYIDTKVKTQGVSFAYRVQAYKIVSGITCCSNASAEKAHYYVKPVGIGSVANKSAGKLSVTWKKNSAVSGYQIQYAENDLFKNAAIVTVPSVKAASKTIANLQKKKYYVRVRGYKQAKEKTYYSGWSKAKSCVIKK